MIKSIIIKQHEPPPATKYPYLGKNRNENFIVFFGSCENGTVVWSDEKYRIGGHSYKWDESDFTRFNGRIALGNEDSK